MGDGVEGGGHVHVEAGDALAGVEGAGPVGGGLEELELGGAVGAVAELVVAEEVEALQVVAEAEGDVALEGSADGAGEGDGAVALGLGAVALLLVDRDDAGVLPDAGDLALVEAAAEEETEGQSELGRAALEEEQRETVRADRGLAGEATEGLVDEVGRAVDIGEAGSGRQGCCRGGWERLGEPARGGRRSRTGCGGRRPSPHPTPPDRGAREERGWDREAWRCGGRVRGESPTGRRP